MRSASREALATLSRAQESALGSDASAATFTLLAQDLYSVSNLLVAQPRLRRALGDPSTAPDSRAQLIAGLLAGQVGPSTVAVVQVAVRQRWSTPWDLVDALGLAANDALFAAAEIDGVLDDVEDELFRFERILDNESLLATLLDEASVEASRRVALLGDVLGTKVHPMTKALLEHAVTSERTPGLGFAIDDLLDESAHRRARSVARVVSAIELTTEQQDRLAAALGALYGRPLSLRTAVEPAVQGGLVVHVGDEVIDGSVATRLISARAALAG